MKIPSASSFVKSWMSGNKMVEFAYAQHENQQQAAAAPFDATMVADRGSFKKNRKMVGIKKIVIDRLLSQGSAASAADFALFEMLDQYACLIQFFGLIPVRTKTLQRFLKPAIKAI